MTELNNTLFFEMNKPYYVIKGLELDVEFNYLSHEEKALAVEEIETIIQENGLEPCVGETEIEPDDIIYVPSTGEIDYADIYFHYANYACEHGL